MTPTETKPPKKQVRSVSRRACLSCREKKIKCDGVQVCRNCEQLNIECIFVKSHRGGRRTIVRNQVQAEAMLNVAAAATAGPPPTTGMPTATNGIHHDMRMNNPTSNLPILAPGNVHVPPYTTAGPMTASAIAPATSTYSNHHGTSEKGSGLSAYDRSFSLPSIAALGDTFQDNGSKRHIMSSTTPSHAATPAPPPSLSSHVPPPPPPPPPPAPPITAPSGASQQQQQNVPNVHYMIHERISDLQTQINQIRSRLPLSGPVVNVGLPHWQVTERDLSILDLPHQELATYMVNLYYEHFHPNHPFIYPKSAFFRFLKVSTTAALVHAMFSVSCRFLPADRPDIHSYMRDPHYWIVNAKKYTDSLSSTDQLKTCLIIGLGLQGDGKLDQSAEYLDQAAKLIKLHRLDKRHSTQAELDNQVESHALAIATSAQLLERESLVRTLWVAWNSQVMAGTYRRNPDQIPHFNSNLCLPVPDGLYEVELTDWDRKRAFWSDFETELLAATGATTAPSSGYRSFYDASFSLAANQILATTLRQREVTPETKSSLDARIVNIDRLMPANCQSHWPLYATTILMHSEACLRACVFIPNEERPMHIPGSSAFLEQPVDTAHHALTSNPEIQRAFALCSWATQGLRRLMTPDGEENIEQYWKSMHQAFGLQLEFVAAFFCSELVYSRYSKSTPVKDDGVPIAARASQDLKVCVSFLEQMAPVWGSLEGSRRRVRGLYDKVAGLLQ